MKTYLDIFNLLIEKFRKEVSEFNSLKTSNKISEDYFKMLTWKALEIHAMLELFCYEGFLESFAIRYVSSDGILSSDIFVDLKELTLSYDESFYLVGDSLGLRQKGWYLHFFGNAPFDEILARLNRPLYSGDGLKSHCVDIFKAHFRKGGTFKSLVSQMCFSSGVRVFQKLERDGVHG